MGDPSPQFARSRRLFLERVEDRRLLACTAVGDTQVECFPSQGAGTPESAWFRDLAGPGQVEGYTSETSYAPGEALQLHVSTAPVEDYRVEVFRLGWYDGDGARLVACLPNCSGGTIQGTDQGVPAPDPVTKEVDANWAVTDAFIVPEDWESGYYIASLILTSGGNAGEAHFIPFIVRAEAERNADILVQVPVSTWQAYNRWGGHSLYNPNAADKVSFNRPYTNIDDIFRYEYQMLRFLEREGFDVEYATNVDVHREPDMLLDHQLVISTGHDEYWSKETRDGFEAARDAGTNLSFFTANAAYWQVRYENGDRTLVGYKVKPPTASEDPEPDPALKSMRFRELTPPRPECSLIGVQYMSTHTPGFSSDESLYPDYKVDDDGLSDDWFSGTGINPGDFFSNRVGYEWDQIVPGCGAVDPTILFRYDTADGTDAHATKYTAASGATVFATGSMAFSYALDDWRFYGTAVSPADARLQTFARNVLLDLTQQPSSPNPFTQSSDGDGIVQMEAEDNHRVTPVGNHAWSLLAESTASGGLAMFAGPDSGANESTNYVLSSPRMDFDIDFSETGTHYVWILGRAAGSTAPTSDSVHVGFDGIGVPSGLRVQNFSAEYGWSSTLSGGGRASVDVSTTGVHTLNLWMREDGFAADKIVLTTNPTLDIQSLLSSFEQSADGNGIVEIEAEQFDVSAAAGNNAWTSVADPQASGGFGMLAGPDTGSNVSTNYAANSPRLDYKINFVETGTHYLWILGRSSSTPVGSGDSVHAGLDGLEISSLQRIQEFDADFGWSSAISGGSRATFDVDSVGVHTLNLWMREDGFVADKIVVTTNPTLNIEALINPPNPDPSFFQDAGPDGLVDIEAELFDANIDRGGKSWSSVVDIDASGGQALIADPETGANNNANYVVNSPELQYHIDFVQTGTHFVWILGKAGGALVGSSDSVHAGLNGVDIPTLQYFRSFQDTYTWSSNALAGQASFDITDAGTHTLNVWMREDAFVVDRIVITTNPTSDITQLLSNPAPPPAGEGTPSVAFAQGDVSQDGFVTALDVLLVVNVLNSGEPSPTTNADVNRDGTVTALDALLVVNELNQLADGEAEGEPFPAVEASDLAIDLLFSERKKRLFV